MAETGSVRLHANDNGKATTFSISFTVYTLKDEDQGSGTGRHLYIVPVHCKVGR